MKKYLQTNNIMTILGYLFALIFGNLIGIVFFAAIASGKFDIPTTKVLNILSETDIDKLTQIELDCYYFCQSWINFFTYICIIILVVFFARGFLKTDFIKIKEYKKKNIKYLLIALIGFGLLYGGSALLSYLVKVVSDTSSSQNQLSIEGMILNGYAVITFITIFLIAPVAEELVYRKSIFKFFEKSKYRFIPILVSAVCFSLPHMLSPEESFLVWFLLFLNYFSCGAILSLVYELSDQNIYFAILAHMLNNLLGFIFVFI